ncbi:MAG: DUF302 domain-containing protein [Candidatus Dadabacteria bacterium]
MDYNISKKINKPFSEVISLVSEELKKEGFGIISEVDLKAKFKEKLGIDFRNYTILGACNPALAYKAIETEDKIGVLLPCNVLVQEHEPGNVEVSAINPMNSIGGIGNSNLEPVAGEVSSRLEKVIRQL